MASEEMTPGKYATKRALRPGLILLIVLVGTSIYAIGKVSWAVKAYDHYVAGYEQTFDR